MGRPSRKAEGRLEILEAAAGVLAKHSFHGMSMRELAKALGKTPTGFYNYYASKEDLLFDLQKRAFETLTQSATEAVSRADTPQARLYAFIMQHVQYVSTHHAVMQVLIQESHTLPPKQRRAVRAVKERYYDVGRRVVSELVQANACPRAGARPTKTDAAELDRQTYALFGMLNWTYGWYRPHRHGSPQELAATLHRLALCGLRPDCPAHPSTDALHDRFLDIKQVPLLQLV